MQQVTNVTAQREDAYLHSQLMELASCVWQTPKHEFCLTPEVFPISRDMHAQLISLGEAVHEVLAGIGRLAAIAATPDLSRNHAWGMIHRSLWNGIPGGYQRLACKRPNAIPKALKVDLIEDTAGRIRIAEIDGYNERGLGYGTLISHMRDLISPGAATLPGIGKLYAQEVRKQKRGDEITLIYADKERFYLPEFLILQEELEKEGITLHVASELEAHFKADRLVLDGNTVDSGLLVYHPFLFINKSLNRELAERYLSDEIDYMLPPKPFFGSKAVLAILRNDDEDPLLEAILRSQIPGSALETIRTFIPPTYFLGKSNGRTRKIDGHVLKKTIASGMKGTYFPDDPDFDTFFKQALKSTNSFVLQEEVNQQSYDFRYFTECGTETVRCFSRIIAFYIGRELAEIDVTALPRKAVHGARDCIFLGGVLEAPSVRN